MGRRKTFSPRRDDPTVVFCDVLKGGKWDEIVNMLFVGQKSFTGIPSAHHQACLDENVDAIPPDARVSSDIWRETCFMCPDPFCTNEFHFAVPMSYVFSGRDQGIPGGDDPDADFALAEKLMKFKLLWSDDVSDRTIISALNRHCGWKADHQLAMYLLKFIPIERLVKIRYSSIEGGFDVSIIHIIFWHMPCSEQFMEIYNFFLDHEEFHPLLKEKFRGETPLHKCISHLESEIVKRILTIEPDGDVNCLSETGKYRHACHNFLRFYAMSKNPKIWTKVQEMFKLLEMHGLDLESQDNQGNSIRTAIVHFGWKELLPMYVTGSEPEYIYHSGQRKDLSLPEHSRDPKPFEMSFIQDDGYMTDTVRAQILHKTHIELLQHAIKYAYCKDQEQINAVVDQLMSIIERRKIEYHSTPLAPGEHIANHELHGDFYSYYNRFYGFFDVEQIENAIRSFVNVAVSKKRRGDERQIDDKRQKIQEEELISNLDMMDIPVE